MINKELRKEVEKVYEEMLATPFPYEDLVELANTFREQHPVIEDFTMDFNEFCNLVAGSCTYIIAGKAIPKYQVRFLLEDFFGNYPQYIFLGTLLKDYPDFWNELQRHEKAREILVSTLSIK